MTDATDNRAAKAEKQIEEIRDLLTEFWTSNMPEDELIDAISEVLDA